MFDRKMDIEDVRAAETIVGASVKLKGNLKSDGNITINGNVAGEVHTKADVSIGGSAEVRANIVAKNAVISGILQGNIKTENELKITETGKVYGDIEASVLNIAAGAVFSGRSTMPEKQEPKKAKKFEEEKEIEPEAILMELEG